VIGLAAAVFGASLLGSLHCAGMCGPLAAVYAGSGTGWTGHGAYSLGRLLAYTVLGAAAGAVGAAVDLAGRWAGVGQAASVAAGLLIVLWGVHALLQALGVKIPSMPVPGALRLGLQAGMARLHAKSPLARAGLLGLLSALLPCGWLWAYVITAAGTGSALGGAALMAVFWAGTLPVMLAVGAAVQAAAGPLRRFVPAVCAVVLVVVGLYAVVHRAGIHPAPGAAGQASCCDPAR